MSELKTYDFPVDPGDFTATVELFYFKSEADKVIADLEESHKMEVEQLLMEIVKLKSDIADLRDDKKSTDAILDERNAEIAELKDKLRHYPIMVAMIESDKLEIVRDKYKIRHHKYKRCLLYAKNHKNLGDLAVDTARLIGLNAYKFTKETETACVAYWNRIRDCHYRHHDEWLELAEKFKEEK